MQPAESYFLLDGYHVNLRCVFVCAQQGYLAPDLKEEALGKLSKRLAAVTEDLTRYLEKLDALSLGSSNPEIKTKRKSVVQRIQVQVIKPN